ncbi:hypothetical protein GWI33_014459 [Rhynchophorus ferrugineus]|uniref:GPI transamidase component PIG-S n=1 Tax=Rhynchophorus ferrugineus TaxID=354439 RepID=A0A834M5I2_RHYFE|nr:hypothetical protein GWI33_014459 [Rhynchophorus ferrugineus]
MTTKVAEKDNTKSADEKGDTIRVLSVLSYCIVLVLLGIPIWWYTTRVYRASLPLDEIENLQLKEQLQKEFGIPLSLEYDLLISFVHPDPGTLNVDVDILKLDSALTQFSKNVLPIADFTIKSQWLYLTELGAIPQKRGDHLALMETQLPHIITPLETKLWSHLSPRPTNKKSSTNAFVSPRWGGIYIANADIQSCKQGTFRPDINNIIFTFEQMLLDLFKVQNITEASVQELKQRKTHAMIESSKKTLKSLAQLLSEINSIVISDEIADKINLAVESIQQAETFSDKGNYDEAMIKGKIAFKNSEEAFGHPSLLALLYFPDDQKYAIYIPLFLPVMIPVVMSLTQIKKKISKKKVD